MKNITPCLWFDTQGEEAAKFYTSLFPNSKITKVSYYGENMPMPAGTAMMVEFTLNGQDYLALNGGTAFKLTEAFSLIILCESQEEVDRYWDALLDGGTPSQCGWLKDKFGMSWQITPTILTQYMTDPDKAKAGRVAQAMMKMVKIDIAAIEAAAKG